MVEMVSRATVWGRVVKVRSAVYVCLLFADPNTQVMATEVDLSTINSLGRHQAFPRARPALCRTVGSLQTRAWR